MMQAIILCFILSNLRNRTQIIGHNPAGFSKLPSSSLFFIYEICVTCTAWQQEKEEKGEVRLVSQKLISSDDNM